MEDTILFTRLVTLAESHNFSNETILDSLESSIRTFVDACQEASLVSVESREFNSVDKTVDQPFIKAKVEYTNSIEQDLIHPQVSAIGDLSQFESNIPIRLLGPRKWINKESATPIEEIDPKEPTPHFIDKIADMIFEMIK